MAGVTSLCPAQWFNLSKKETVAIIPLPRVLLLASHWSGSCSLLCRMARTLVDLHCVGYIREGRLVSMACRQSRCKVQYRTYRDNLYCWPASYLAPTMNFMVCVHRQICCIAIENVLDALATQLSRWSQVEQCPCCAGDVLTSNPSNKPIACYWSVHATSFWMEIAQYP